MEKPIAEIVRFEEQDVIATSGGSPLTANTRYLALSSEMNQAGYNTHHGDSNDPWVYFNSDKTYYALFLNSGKFDTKRELDTSYAWFANNQWWTNNQSVKVLGYGYDSNLPTESSTD